MSATGWRPNVLERAREGMEVRLNQIGQLLPDAYKLTLLARHTEMPAERNADILLTIDDPRAIILAIERLTSAPSPSEPGSPQLAEPLRSRERAALDIAVKALRYIDDAVHRAAVKGREVTGIDFVIEGALDKIGAIVPKAVKK